MKILIFLIRWKGGVGVVINSIKKELIKKGHTVTTISREEDLKYFSSVKSIFELRKRYKKIIEKENPDIIYTQDWSMALPLLFPLPLFEKKHYCCFHGNQFGKTVLLQTLIGKWFGKNLFVVGNSLKKRFPKSTLVHNGVDLKKFKPLKKKRNCLGWINKSTEMFTKEEILILAKKLKLKPLIAENFKIPFDKMNEDFYNKCKVFVSLPPHSAGFNLCWVEAMAAGVPIIAGNNEGIGCKLPIDKFKSKEHFLKNLKNLTKKNYRKEIIKIGLTWENHVKRLLEIWKK